MKSRKAILKVKIHASLEKRGLITNGKVDDKIKATDLYEIAIECNCELEQVMFYIRYGLV